jgi:hypothetical protein
MVTFILQINFKYFWYRWWMCFNDQLISIKLLLYERPIKCVWWHFQYGILFIIIHMNIQSLKVCLFKFFLQIHVKLYLCTCFKHKFDRQSTSSNTFDWSLVPLKSHKSLQLFHKMIYNYFKSTQNEMFNTILLTSELLTITVYQYYLK